MYCAFTARSAKKVSTLNLTEPARQLQQIMFILFQFGKRKFLSLRFLLDLLQELLATFTKFCVFLFALGLKACDNASVKGGIECISYQNEAAASLAFDLSKEVADESLMFLRARQNPHPVLQAHGTHTLQASPYRNAHTRGGCWYLRSKEQPLAFRHLLPP